MRALLKQFLLYRTYHGSAMSPVVQQASIAAWSDEQHVIENRALYRGKFAQVTPLLSPVLDVSLPDAGFYLWAGVQGQRHRVRPGFAGSIQCHRAARQLLARDGAGIEPRRRPHPHGPGRPDRRMRGSRATHRPVRQVQT